MCVSVHISPRSSDPVFKESLWNSGTVNGNKLCVIRRPFLEQAFQPKIRTCLGKSWSSAQQLQASASGWRAPAPRSASTAPQTEACRGCTSRPCLTAHHFQMTSERRGNKNSSPRETKSKRPILKAFYFDTKMSAALTVRFFSRWQGKFTLWN